MASNALVRLSQRTPLRVKLITALLALVALALAVISFTSIAFFRAYLVDQSDNQLHTLINESTVSSQNQNGSGAGGNGGYGGGQSLHAGDLFALAIQGNFLQVLDDQG